MTDACDIAMPRFPVLVVLRPFALFFALCNCFRGGPWRLIARRKVQVANGVTEPGQ